ncbi:MAG: (Fe-S)-binding protein [Flavobacteriales bacterium]|jgi:heterodisulfide reductase subunit C|nr:(Fe-S)-binding protein [Flavobacteriales bacterium]
MGIISNILFAILLAGAIFFFTKNIKRIRRNIFLGKKIDRSDRSAERWKLMAKVALGQSKMTVRPIAGLLHIIVYAGFVIINIEVLEIIIDGLFGTHRVLSFMGGFYDFLIGSFEILAFLVLLACVVFFVRRNIVKIRRFNLSEMKGWPKNDANLILMIEIALMSAFLFMNASDYILQTRGADHFVQAGSFPISSMLVPLIDGLSNGALMFIERFTWWFHIIGILFFLNYIIYSKHLHIALAFPNVFYAKLEEKGKLDNLEAVTNEVKMMMDPNADPFAAPDPGAEEDTPERFGAKDATDLTWVQLMNAYSCTECGRCTSECPANQTGKKLSPRKIMMDTRDRIEEIGNFQDKNGADKEDGKSLIDDYISREEIWACTSCNACTEACPINIDPLSIIVDLRRYLVMEESAAPTELNMIFNNIENNGAPWQFSPADRLNWAEELKEEENNKEANA